MLHLDPELLVLLALLLFGQLGLDHFDDLRNRLVFVLDHLLLPHEEDVVIQNQEEESQMGNRLVDAGIGQLGTSLEDLVDAVGVGLSDKKRT